TFVYLPIVTWLTGIPRRARGCPALHPWRDPCRRVSGDGMRVEPSLMHPEGGSWTEVRTHTPSKFSKVQRTFVSHPLGALQVSGERITALRRTGLAAFTASGSPPLVHLLAYVRSLPSHFLSLHRASRWTACAFAEYLCSGSFPKAGGLRHQSSSWCARLSRTPTTMPPLTSQAGIGFSSGSRLPTSTILPILPGISRVPTVGLKRDDVGGVLTWCPFRSRRLPRLFTG